MPHSSVFCSAKYFVDFLNRGVDHSTLCPWCDELLPPVPSPHLQKLIDDARKRSFRDSRPSNTYGLRAQLTVFSTVCQRHTFERVHVPLAEKNGWPMKIKWDELSDRVTALKEVLKRIVDDVDEEWLPGHVMTEEEKKETDKQKAEGSARGEQVRCGSNLRADRHLTVLNTVCSEYRRGKESSKGCPEGQNGE